MTHLNYKALWLWVLLTAFTPYINAQTIYQYKQDDATVCFFDKNQSQYVPYLMRKYQLGRALHAQIWGELPTQAPFMMLTDWNDDGNAGVAAIPHTLVQIGMAPLNMSYFVAPSNERYDHLFKHEYTHIVMTDKADRKDMGFRRFTGNKVVPDSNSPMSALWGYLGVPRWYAPRWYHEGIACFLETWLTDGVGRALGGYDETYFRALVDENKRMCSIVGLETEGTTSDFQQGATSYMYGTRFVNYLVLQYGFDKLVQFYNHSEGSRTFYAKQFEKVYGLELRDAWNQWEEYEKKHQKEQIDAICEYDLTDAQQMLDRNLGAMSPIIIDEENKAAYAAVNHNGDFAKIVRLDLDESLGKATKMIRLAYVDDEMGYQTAYLTLDSRNGRLIWTDRNNQMRGLVVFDLKKNRVVKRLKYQRQYDICYDNARDCLYGLMSNQGVCHLTKYDAEFKNLEILYSFPFGVSVSNLDVSHDGKYLVASLLGKDGGQSLIRFNVDDFENAVNRYETLYSLSDGNLTHFRFSHDDSRLVGVSYYTGVSNAWEYDLATGDFNLLSNVKTGLFGPYLASNDRIYALQYSSEGMIPVSFEHKVLNDANSVEFLGQKAFEADPVIAEISTLKKPLPEITFGEVYDSVKTYNPFREIRFQGAYPDISAFVDRKAWNNMIPVLGYRVDFYDPLSLFKVKLFAGVSPWSNNDWKNRFHLSADIKYYRWSFNAAWNPVCFYDLFGPRRASRKGYQVSLSYDYVNSLNTPYTIDWGASIATYGDMDALPLYQEIEVDKDITSFQTASAYFDFNRLTSTIGAVTSEAGYNISARAYTYFAGGKFFPSLDISGNYGFLLPFGEHNTMWLKAGAGQNFGNEGSSLGNSYFGGFRNNYVDNGPINRYRTLAAMPGASIDQICAHNYAKFSGDITFCPIRFNNFGALQFYPNFIQFTVFGHDLMTDWWGNGTKEKRDNYISAGAQMDIQLVIFTHMRTTLSFGYARVWGGGLKQGEFMVSLKLL